MKTVQRIIDSSASTPPHRDPVPARATIERVTPPGRVRDRVLGENLAELLGIA